MRTVELRLQRRPTITGVARRQLPRDMRHDSRRIHFQQTIARDHLDDEKIARRIEIHAEGLAQLRLEGGEPHSIVLAAGNQNEGFSDCPQGAEPQGERRKT